MGMLDFFILFAAVVGPFAACVAVDKLRAVVGRLDAIAEHLDSIARDTRHLEITLAQIEAGLDR